MAVDNAETVFDEGLQLERTALAWQRTLLALAVASLALGRGLQLVIGPVSWVVAGAGLAVTMTMFALTRRRYVRTHHHLTHVDAFSLPGSGLLIAAASIVCAAAGLSALAFVIHQQL